VLAMKFNPKGLLVTAAWVLLILVAFEAHKVEAVDNLYTIALVVFVTMTSIAIVVARVRGRNVAGQAGALREIQRWFSP
jgi:hypothetical protein